MSKECIFCGKKPQVGNLVSHSNIKTKRRFNPNLQRVRHQFADGSVYQWELNQDDKKITHRPEGQWALSDSYMEAEAARLGLGLAYVPVELVADDLEHGKLIRVLQRYSLRLEGLFLYYPHRNVSPALRMVIDTLKI